MHLSRILRTCYLLRLYSQQLFPLSRLLLGTKHLLIFALPLKLAAAAALGCCNTRCGDEARHRKENKNDTGNNEDYLRYPADILFVDINAGEPKGIAAVAAVPLRIGNPYTHTVVVDV